MADATSERGEYEHRYNGIGATDDLEPFSPMWGPTRGGTAQPAKISCFGCRRVRYLSLNRMGLAPKTRK
jgi:hypothetical protein